MLGGGLLFSRDGRFLHIVSQPGNAPLISTISATTFEFVGVAPAFTSVLLGLNRAPPLIMAMPSAIDSTGLLFGQADHGVSFDDATNFLDIPFDIAAPVHLRTITPSEGPLQGGTAVMAERGPFTATSDIWFGDQRGTDLAMSLVAFFATSPPSLTNRTVNVKVVQPNGMTAVLAQGYTYGGEILGQGFLAAAPDGGAQVDIFGQGFFGDIASQSVQVLIRSQNASVISKTDNSASGNGYPYPLHHLKVTVPAASPGVADITVNSVAGSVEVVPPLVET